MIAPCTPPDVDTLLNASEMADIEHVAKTFLQGERSLAGLQRNESVAQLLDAFLEAAGDAPLRIAEADAGLIRLRTSDGAACLSLTGKTAEVLRGYLRGEDVSITDRMDMTVRRGRVR